ncbi:MAG: hypothetical protein AAF797_17605 [Planctomycetota bacterium]
MFGSYDRDFRATRNVLDPESVRVALAWFHASEPATWIDLRSPAGMQVAQAVVPRLDARASDDGVGLVNALARLAQFDGSEFRVQELSIRKLLRQTPPKQIAAVRAEIEKWQTTAERIEAAVRYSLLERLVRRLGFWFGKKRRWRLALRASSWSVDRLMRRAVRKGRFHSTNTKAQDRAIATRLRSLDA